MSDKVIKNNILLIIYSKQDFTRLKNSLIDKNDWWHESYAVYNEMGYAVLKIKILIVKYYIDLII